MGLASEEIGLLYYQFIIARSSIASTALDKVAKTTGSNVGDPFTGMAS